MKTQALILYVKKTKTYRTEMETVVVEWWKVCHVKNLLISKNTTQQAFKELCEAHADLQRALEKVGDGEIVGFGELYSKKL